MARGYDREGDLVEVEDVRKHTMAQPAVMPWVEGASRLPGWMSETEGEIRQLIRVTEDQGKRIEDLEERMRILMDTFAQMAGR